MAITVTTMARIFQFQGIRLPDPNPEMSVEEVKALYAAQYPELATAVVPFFRRITPFFDHASRSGWPSPSASMTANPALPGSSPEATLCR